MILISWVVVAVWSLDSFEEVSELLENYSSEFSNYTEIKALLEKKSDNPQVLSKLAEFWLFGVPVAPSNPNKDPLLLNSQGIFKRDFQKAFNLFEEAYKAGSKDAAFFLGFVLQHSQLVEDFEFGKGDFEKYYLESLARGSSLGRAAMISAYTQCVNSHTIKGPFFLKKALFPKVDDCGNCENLASHSAVLANEAIEYITSRGTSFVGVGKLFEEEMTINSGENTLKLYERFIEEDPEGFVNIAENHLLGNPHFGLERNVDQALNYYQVAGQQNNLRALENLAVFYLNGIGVPQNTTKAFEYFEKAKEMGSAHALNGLGYMYLNGLGVPVDKQKAFEYIKQAADLGDPESNSNLGVFYLNGETVEKNYQEAIKHFLSAAEAGHFAAKYNLGLMYLNGIGVEKSCRQAMELFRQVWQKGELAHKLSRAYSFYKYQDYQGTYLTYALGATLGFENAQLSAGYMWEQKLPFFKCRLATEECAGSFYLVAAQVFKSDWPFLKLGNILYSRLEFEEAYEYYLQAKTYPEAVFSMGYMKEKGLGVDQNTTEAYELYRSIIAGVHQGKFEYLVYFPARIAMIKLDFMQKLKSLVIFKWA